jgi:hypothetical protein
VYIYKGGEVASSYDRTHVQTFSDALRTAHPRLTFCEHRECGRAGLQNRRSQSDTCTGVRAIRVLGSVLATACFVRPTNANQVLHRRASFEGLHCVHLSASTLYDYIEHTHDLSRVNGATDALSIGSSAWYNPFFVFVHILLLFTAYESSDTHMHIHVVTCITVIFWIKLKLKMTICPTPCAI